MKNIALAVQLILPMTEKRAKACQVPVHFPLRMHVLTASECNRDTTTATTNNGILRKCAIVNSQTILGEVPSPTPGRGL
jgi:hypothetical protein